MVKLILHAGMHKCGSTFIQNTLFENREALQRAGILYPATGLSTSNPSIGFRHVQLTHAIKSGRTTMRDELYREIESSKAHTVVISHEGMALPEYDAGKFSEAYRRYDTTVVLYVRSPADYIEALYRSSICTGTISAEIGPFIEGKWARLDLRALVEKWRAAFGPDRVRIFPFAQLGRDYPLAHHLLEAGGVALPPLPPTRQSNPRETNFRTMVKLVANQMRARDGLEIPPAALDGFAIADASNQGRLVDDAMLARLAPRIAAYEAFLADEGFEPTLDRLIGLPFDPQFFDPALREQVRQLLLPAAIPAGLPAGPAVVAKASKPKRKPSLLSFARRLLKSRSSAKERG